MSKIGRRPIDIGSAQIKIDGQIVHYKGANAEGEYVLPNFMSIELDEKKLKLSISKDKLNRETNDAWGLHRALLSNAIIGADKGFERILKIIGLGYKAILSGKNVQFSLGFSHKIDIELPKGIELKVEKSGQLLTFKSYSKKMLGDICDKIRSLRPPEPYKGMGIRYSDEEVARKAGKTKAS